MARWRSNFRACTVPTFISTDVMQHSRHGLPMSSTSCFENVLTMPSSKVRSSNGGACIPTRNSLPTRVAGEPWMNTCRGSA